MKHVKKIFEKLNSFIKYNLQLYFVFFFCAFRISKKKNIPNMKIIIIVGIIEVKSSFKTTVLKFKTCEYDFSNFLSKSDLKKVPRGTANVSEVATMLK